MRLPLGQREPGAEFAVGGDCGGGDAGEPHPQSGVGGLPDVGAGAARAERRAASVVAADPQPHDRPGGPGRGAHAAQHDRAVRVGGHGEGVPALDDTGGEGPAGGPDQGAVAVAPAGHVPRVLGGHLEGAGAADEFAEHGGRVPAGDAQPHERAVGAEQRPALAVGEQGVLAQRPRPVRGAGGLGRLRVHVITSGPALGGAGTREGGGYAATPDR